MTDNHDHGTYDGAIHAAGEAAIERLVGQDIDSAVIAVCRYVNALAGTTVIAETNNEVRHTLIALLLAYDERLANAKG